MAHDQLLHLPDGAGADVLSLRIGIALTGTNLFDLHLACFGMCLDITVVELDAVLTGNHPAGADYNRIAHALNEQLMTSTVAYRVPYRDELPADAW